MSTLGSALLVVATLHSAGQLGWNVHSLSYVLMFIVIVSGFYGVYTYINYPAALTGNRSGSSRAALFAELYELNVQARAAAVRAPSEINVAVTSAIERTAIGGSIYAQLIGRDSSLYIPPDGSGKPRRNPDQQPVIDLIADRIPKTSKVAETELLEALLEIFCRRQAVLRRIATDIRLQGRIRVLVAHSRAPVDRPDPGADRAHRHDVYLLVAHGRTATRTPHQQRRHRRISRRGSLYRDDHDRQRARPQRSSFWVPRSARSTRNFRCCATASASAVGAA